MTSQAKIPFTKHPTTFAEQVQILLSHGIIIPDPVKAEFYLSQLNYYRLAAYCLPFEINHATHQVALGTTFDDVLNLYIFDRELRLLLLDAIERIEVSLRTKMAYHLSHGYNTAHPHLDQTIFKNKTRYQAGLKNLQSEVTKSNEDFIRHLTAKYQEVSPPIWAVVELMTMGQLSKWYSNIAKRADRQAISVNWGLNEQVTTSFCEHLSLVRNIAAHHARLWNRKITKKMTLPTKGPAKLLASISNLPDQDPNLRKLYNTLTMTLYLMNVIAPNNQLKVRLKNLIARHGIDTLKMGLPQNWEKRPLWL
ncbi:CAAX amino protease [Shewanella algicola]|uniref:Abi family protein n=1 Tax=Shewanella algicola TaxID=640633 RepID=A0A9X1ZDC7_9GAMM|nr:Abi family protein [Shewanella algicola]MCL1105043.1 Abi family protein [Shewanella algicola]GGP48145.1 CAAX amino protease [Shewanella algicola]